MPHHVVNYCTTSSKVCIPSGVSAKIEMSSMQPIIFTFYYQSRLRGPMSLLSVFNSVQVWQLQCTFLQMHLLIKFKSSKFFFNAFIYFSFFACQLFLVFGYAGVGDSSFLMKGTFCFLTGQFWYSKSHLKWQFRVAKAQSSKLKVQSSNLKAQILYREPFRVSYIKSNEDSPCEAAAFKLQILTKFVQWRQTTPEETVRTARQHSMSTVTGVFWHLLRYELTRMRLNLSHFQRIW